MFQTDRSGFRARAERECLQERQQRQREHRQENRRSLDSLDSVHECFNERDDANREDSTNKSRLPPRLNCAVRNGGDDNQHDQRCEYSLLSKSESFSRKAQMTRINADNVFSALTPRLCVKPHLALSAVIAIADAATGSSCDARILAVASVNSRRNKSAR